jgi:hypothetical protein
VRLSRRALIALLSGLLILPLVPGVALGGVFTFGASAGLTPVRQLVGDSTGSLYTLTVRNTSDSPGIGAVEIKRPSNFWTVASCPGAPTGWTTEQQADRCRYISAAGTLDNIFPGDPDAQFTLVVSTADSVRDVGGKWSVLVSMTEDLDNISAVTLATPMGFGLRTRAFSFQIMDAVVADVPATVGSACPASNRSADAGSTHTLVLCGSNRSTQTQTLKPRFAGLKGTFIRSHGAFSSGPVAPTDTSVVLGNWSNVKITTAVGEDMTVLARVRSAPKRTSAWKTMEGFESVGIEPVGPAAPVANNDGYNTNEDTTLIAAAAGVLGNDTDANSDSLTVSSVNGNAANVGTQIATTNGLVTVNADGSFSYIPDGDFSGLDSFTYTAFDGLFQSNSATVSMTVNPDNDPPVADNEGYGTDQNQGFTVTAAGILVGDTDVDLDVLTVGTVNGSAANVGTAILTTSNGTVTVNADGSFSYTPANAFTGADSFTYTAFDGTAQSNTATVNITVNSTGGGGGGGGCFIAC